ncbi:MAG: hypothetical protein H6968_16975 [Chromatiaceae bacterium]|nr:hypothetical protein [Chromatiaceae bacterium]
MSQGKHITRRIRILVKAFPQPSSKYEETVCCAGVTEDTRELLRLYPIRYRRLDKADRFDRFDQVEMTTTKAGDHRPESYHVDEDSIHLLEKGSKLNARSKVELWKPFIAPSLKALMEENRTSHKSLGIIRPDPDSLRFRIQQVKETDNADQKVTNLIFQQQISFLEEPLKPLKRPEYSFSYHYTCDGHPHKHQIHDWEVQATLINYQRRYGSEEKALEMMQQEYQENIPKHNLHFIMGTMKAHPQTFIVIGLLRSTIDPQELDRQGVLPV